MSLPLLEATDIGFEPTDKRLA